MKKRSKPKNIKQARENLRGYVYLMPWLIGFIIFTVFPLFYTFYLSFSEVKLTVLGWEVKPIGMGNYVTALLRNVEFGPNLGKFLVMELIYVPTIVIISFILAILLNQKIKFRSIFRIIFFLPVIVLSGSVMHQLMDSGNTKIVDISSILIFRMIYSYSPMLSNILEILFQNFSLVLWFTGIPIILFINGLQKINQEVYEAAQIDGATPWQILWKITIPVIKEIALVVTIFTIVQLGTLPINPVAEMIKEAIFNTAGGLGLAATYAYVYSILVICIIGIPFLLLKLTQDSDIPVKRKRV